MSAPIFNTVPITLMNLFVLVTALDTKSVNKSVLQTLSFQKSHFDANNMPAFAAGFLSKAVLPADLMRLRDGKLSMDPVQQTNRNPMASVSCIEPTFCAKYLMSKASCSGILVKDC